MAANDLGRMEPMKKRCPGSKKEVRLRGLQIVYQKAPCPDCQKLIALQPQDQALQKRQGLLKAHMREVSDEPV